MKKHIIETERCYISALDEGDIAKEIELCADPFMTEFMDPPQDYDEEVQLCREYAQKVYGKYGYGMWGIFDRGTDELIGEAGLEPRFDVDRQEYPYDWMFERNCAELGFFVAHSLWGQGYCTEACREILDYCAKNFGIPSVFARVLDDNVASVRVLEKLGFSRYDGNLYIWRK